METLCKGLIAGALALGLCLPSAQAQSLSEAQRGEVEQIIREYLLSHPELLMEVSDELEKRQKAETESTRKEMLVSYRDELFHASADHVENPDGRIPLVEFFDYQCGYCKRVFPDLLRVRGEVGDVRVIFKEFPILGPESVYAARVAIAAKRQGKYIRFHDAMMSFKGHVNETSVMATAKKVGLDLEQLKDDMQRPEVQAEIDANLALGQRMSIRGTPTMLIGEKLVPGAIAYGQMQPMFEAMRESCSVC